MQIKQHHEICTAKKQAHYNRAYSSHVQSSLLVHTSITPFQNIYIQHHTFSAHKQNLVSTLTHNYNFINFYFTSQTPFNSKVNLKISISSYVAYTNI